MKLSMNPAISSAVFALCLNSSQLSAEEQTVLKPLERPDPTSVTVPSLIAISKDDYFYFWKPGVSYGRAFSDLDECRLYSLQASLNTLPPRFVPLGSAAVKSESEVSNQSAQFNLFAMYGLAGGLIADGFIQGAEDDNTDTTNRRCMMYKGYRRYGTTQGSWKQITSGTDTEKLARLALIASGAEPKAGDIGP